MATDATKGHGSPAADRSAHRRVEQHLEPRAAQLLITLAEVVELLKVHDEPGWALTMAGIQPDDAAGLRRLLPGRGGAEDFHAVYLTTRDGHWLNPTDGRVTNERLSLLRATLYMDARALMRRGEPHGL